MRKIVVLAGMISLCLLGSPAFTEEEIISGESTEPDTLSLPAPVTPIPYENVELDSVSYAADSIHYDVTNDLIILSKRASMTYHTANIEADEIIIDMENDQAFTRGETWMKDGTQILYGTEVRFALTTEQGFIREGASRMEKGFYYGEEIRKVGEDVYDIDRGYFTTCEIKEPNFYIYSGKMRLYYRDKIVAKPIIFYVNHFPLLLLPFGTFSIKTERASGILVPEPGYNNVDGKYLENIALYYAYDDYAEIVTALDWREKTGWEARLESNYIRRYFFNGSLLARYQHRIDSPSATRQEWYLRARHRNDFIDRSTLDANLEFMSSRTVWESSEIIDERLSERVTSSVAYRRPFASTTLSSGATYSENLTEKTKQIVLPSMSFSLPSKPVYELFTSKTRAADAWWTNFNYSYSFRATHTGSITDPAPSLADILYKNSRDPDGNYINRHNAGIRHSVGLSYNRTLAGWLNFSQSLSGNEVWFDRDINSKTLVRGHDYGTNTRISASLFGIGSYPQTKIRAVRHVLSPSVAFSYSPDFQHNDRFYRFGGIGLNTGPRRQNINLGLDNRWSLKYFDAKTNKEQALNDIFTLSSSVSYDLEKEEKQFSDISHTAGFRPQQVTLPGIGFRLSTSGSARQDAYDFHLLNWRVSNSLNISGETEYYNYFPQEKNVFFSGSSFQPETNEEDISLDSLQETERDVTRLSHKYPWDITFNHEYSRTVSTGVYSSSLRSSLSLRLTYNWSINYNNYIDLQKNDLISQSLSISRDMICWKLLFTWSKQGDYWNYRIQFYNIKLPDALRLRRSDYRRG
jgi:lipopolysaccharide assembly outer membrane protein LptD (OstA)